MLASPFLKLRNRILVLILALVVFLLPPKTCYDRKENPLKIRNKKLSSDWISLKRLRNSKYSPDAHISYSGCGV